MWVEDIAKQFQLTVQNGTFEEVAGRAVFNEAGDKRYFLEKRWQEGDRILTIFMQNPNEASHETTDSTVETLKKMAMEADYDGMRIINISAKIKKATDLEQEGVNEEFIYGALEQAEDVFLAWGLNGQKMLKKYPRHQEKLQYLLLPKKDQLFSLEISRSMKENNHGKAVYFPPIPAANKELEGMLPLDSFNFELLFL